MADDAGRISKQAFIGSSSALLGLCVVSTVIRLYIRLKVQKEIGWDDAFLVMGLCCLIAGVTLIFTIMDYMYMTEAFVFGHAGFGSFNFDLINKAIYYRKMSAAGLTLMWISICSVKFSFLSLFRKLIRQMPSMLKYWWFALAFNIVISSYGTVVYLVACPYFKEDQLLKALQCVQGNGLKTAMSYSESQMVLDIAGDLFILVIPIILIWQIRIRWTQKLALIFTLCLTIVMIIITVARIIGLKWHGKLDSVWETYFIVIAAEVGLTLVAVTAFRALFVAKTKRHRQVQDTITTLNWYSRGRSAVIRAVSRVTGRHDSGNPELDASFDGSGEKKGKRYLKNEFPRATMTGVRSFIDRQGQTQHSVSSSDVYVAEGDV